MSIFKSNISWFGILLVIIGLIMLLDHLGVFSINFSLVFWPLMMLLGVVITSKGFTSLNRGKIFWGSVLFLYSLFFLIRSIDYFYVRGQLIFPASFMIFGIAFLMMYLGNMKDWPLIIPAAILMGMGVVFFLTEYGYLYRREVWEAIADYWPVLLIIVGLILILRRKNDKTPPSEKPAL